MLLEGFFVLDDVVLCVLELEELVRLLELEDVGRLLLVEPV